MPPRIPADDLLDELHRLAEDGVAPSQTDMENRGEFGVNTYRRRFGSWLEGVEIAGLEPAQEGRSPTIPEEDLLDELHRLAEDGHAPTAHKMEQEGAFSKHPYRRAFGSWAGACKAAGLNEPVSECLSPVMREALKAHGGDD